MFAATNPGRHPYQHGKLTWAPRATHVVSDEVAAQLARARAPLILTPLDGIDPRAPRPPGGG